MKGFKTVARTFLINFVVGSKKIGTWRNSGCALGLLFDSCLEQTFVWRKGSCVGSGLAVYVFEFKCLSMHFLGTKFLNCKKKSILIFWDLQFHCLTVGKTAVGHKETPIHT